MRTFVIALSLALVACSSNSTKSSSVEFVEGNSVNQKDYTMSASSFYDLSAKDIEGNDFSFESLKGKRVMIVNTASECGYTPQYTQLQELYQNYKDHDFVILGFPCNDFGGQEPGSEAQIQNFCSANFGVTFPMMSKVAVKGDNAHPVYRWLTQQTLNGVSDGQVKWNFHKFLVDENGNWIAEYSSSVSPLDESIVQFILKGKQ